MNILTESLPHVNKNMLEDITGKFRPWNSKNEVLVKFNSTPNKLFFINRGFAILKIKVNGKKWVRHIARAGEFITAIESFEYGTPSQEEIIALGQFEILFIERDVFMHLKNKHEEVNELYYKFIKNALISCQKRINDLLSLDAEQYYEKLLTEKQYIFTMIPQYELASYLGIQPQSLSRIRSAIRMIS